MAFEEKRVENIDFDSLTYDEVCDFYMLYMGRYDRALNDLLFILRYKHRRSSKEMMRACSDELKRRDVDEIK